MDCIKTLQFAVCSINIFTVIYRHISELWLGLIFISILFFWSKEIQLSTIFPLLFYIPIFAEWDLILHYQLKLKIYEIIGNFFSFSFFFSSKLLKRIVKLNFILPFFLLSFSFSISFSLSLSPSLSLSLSLSFRTSLRKFLNFPLKRFLLFQFLSSPTLRLHV